VDNKPFAVMINLGDEDLQEILLMGSRLRAQAVQATSLACPK
jgi:hypothetical protein